MVMAGSVLLRASICAPRSATTALAPAPTRTNDTSAAVRAARASTVLATRWVEESNDDTPLAALQVFNGFEIRHTAVGHTQCDLGRAAQQHNGTKQLALALQKQGVAQRTAADIVALLATACMACVPSAKSCNSTSSPSALK